MAFVSGRLLPACGNTKRTTWHEETKKLTSFDAVQGFTFPCKRAKGESSTFHPIRTVIALYQGRQLHVAFLLFPQGASALSPMKGYP